MFRNLHKRHALMFIYVILKLSDGTAMESSANRHRLKSYLLKLVEVDYGYWFFFCKGV